MTLDQLKYFFEAARFQHIGKAAKAVPISASAVSAAIASLEEEFGARLFDRVGKTVQLTDSGKRLQKEAESLFDQIDSVKFKVTGKEDEFSGRYRLGASHFLSTFLAGAWSDLQEDNPSLIGEICSLPTETLIRDVVSGALDFGLCFSPFSHPDLHVEQIYRGQLQVVVKKNHALKKVNLRDHRNLSVLSDYPAVIHKDRPGVDVCENHPMFDRFGITPRTRFLFDSDACAIEKIVRSDAWTLVPDVVTKRYSKQVESLPMPLKWDAPYVISIVLRRDRIKNFVLSRKIKGALQGLEF